MGRNPDIDVRQIALMLEIVAHLDDGAVRGEWPDQMCHYCTGKSGGYSDSQSFEHRVECVVLKIERLRKMISTDPGGC